MNINRLLTHGNRLLVLLLLTDLGFILAHGLHVFTPLLSNSLFSITRDWGFGEVFNYMKEFWLLTMFAILYWNRRQPLYLLWAALFAFFLFDDALLLHERLGMRLATGLNLPALAGLRSVDLGELLVMGAAGGLPLLLILLMTWHSQGEMRRISWTLLKFMGLLIVFGVAADMLHVVVQSADQFWGLLEDGGEMVVLSLVTAFVFSLDRPRSVAGEHHTEHI